MFKHTTTAATAAAAAPRPRPRPPPPPPPTTTTTTTTTTSSSLRSQASKLMSLDVYWTICQYMYTTVPISIGWMDESGL